ncbi:MAG: Crp/Fnr family transcriptional regulator [Synechococcales bacterium]|nr:Crp/Fnr family transcriptional regulator [Synechococcales bacterium]
MSANDSISPLQNQSPLVNRILAALPEAEYRELASHLELVELPRGRVLYEPGDRIQTVYFPNSAMVSLVARLETGGSVEIGVVGREGMVGLPVVWGGQYASSQAIVQIPGAGYRLPDTVLKNTFDRGGTLQRLLLLYTQALFAYVSQTAACNRQHRLEERLARWLLIVHDITDSDCLPLTQEFLAEMLGTGRSTVTTAAGILQQSGGIRYSRGKIVIADRSQLERTVCECYGRIKAEFARLLKV